MDGCFRAAPCTAIDPDLALGDAGETEIDTRRASAIFTEGGKDRGGAFAYRAIGRSEIVAHRAAAAFLFAINEDLDIDPQFSGIRQRLDGEKHAGERALVVFRTAGNEAFADAFEIDDAALERIDRPAFRRGGHDVIHVVEDDGLFRADIDAGVDNRRAAVRRFSRDDACADFAL
ncbi:hypothetical protein D3C71_1007200 [compost metagenome]